MWKILLWSCCIAGLIACKKSELTTAKLVTINASHSLTNITARWNGVTVTNNPLQQAQYSGTTANLYSTIPAGTSTLLLQTGSTTLLNKNIYAGPLNAYTLLLYDTAAAPGSTLVAYLNDDIAATSGKDSVFVRFLFCVPSVNNVDVILLNPVANDTIFKNVSFLNGSSAEKTAEQFTVLKNRGITGIKINKTGTNEPLATLPNFSFQQRYYTILYSGLEGATGAAAPQLNVLLH